MQIDRRTFLVFVLATQLISYVAILLDIPIARQIILGFYLLFIPGIILLRIFRLHINKWEAVLFSVGLSVALLMFIGLLMNEILFHFGISKPLETLPLMIMLSAVVLILCVTDFLSNRTRAHSSALKLTLSLETLLLVSLISCPLFLSILASTYLNTSGSNAFMLFLIITISTLVIVLFLLKRTLRSKLYPLAILTISLALLLHTSLVSRYLVGYDIHLEYYVSQLTQFTSYWDKTIAQTYNAMLSVTILPTIYSNLLNFDLTFVFKILYPLIFSLVPLGLYAIYQKQTRTRIYAFLSVFFFMASSTFYNFQMLSLGRQMIAELFFVLLLYLVLDQRIDRRKRTILLVIFGVALVVSHYSISYIFLFYLFLTWLLSRGRLFKKLRELAPSHYFLFFSVVTFSWYMYVAFSAPFTSFVDVLAKTYNSFVGDFLNLEARGYHVQRIVGAGDYSSLLHRTGSVIQNIAQFFILYGFVATIIGKVKVKLDERFVSMSSASVTILLASIFVPFFGPALNTPRFYHIALFALSPFCVLGVDISLRWILSAITSRVSIKALNRLKRNAPVLISMILVTFFLFETGLIYEVSGDYPTSIQLSPNRVNPTQFHGAITSEGEVFSARWLSEYSNRSLRIYADNVAKRQVLISYGATLSARENILSNGTIINEEAYVYLTHLNVIEGKIVGKVGQIWNTSDIYLLLQMENKIYSNHESDIYFTVTPTRP